jgi:crotonobetainyl-CoA:carnitine CoA-transferase CaiB-like acyl-CoA transferase
MPELISDPRFDAAPFAIPRAEDRIWLVDEISRRMRRRPVAEWLEHLHAFDVIAAPVLEPDRILDHEQVKAIDMRWEVDDPTLGELVEPGCPITVAGVATGGPRPPAPIVGAHDPAVIERFRAPAGPSRPPADGPAPPPLSGLRVADLSTFGAGPGASRVLAGLGAEVIKLEPPEGDPFRLLGYSFLGVNAGKRTCRVDAADAATRPLVEQVLAGADVVVHNYRTDVAEKLRMRTEDIAGVNATAVQCAVSGYGARGPLASDPAIDVVFEALTGGPLVQGGGSEPVGYTGGFADNGTSLVGVVAILASLHAQRAGIIGDRGVVTEVSLLATTLYRHAELLVRPLSDWHACLLGSDPVGPNATHRIYPAADGWVLLAVDDVDAWERLRALLEDLPTEYARNAPAWNEQVATRLAAAWASRPRESVVSDLREAGVPATRVERFGDLVRRLRADGDPLVQELDDATWGELLGVHELVSFEHAPWQRLDGPREVDPDELVKDWRS